MPGEVSEEDPGDPGVDERVADDEDVQEGLPEGAAVLHLPAGLVVAPQVQRVVLLGDHPQMTSALGGGGCIPKGDDSTDRLGAILK